MWKKKEVPDYRTITDEVKFNTSGVPKDFKDREFNYFDNYGVDELYYNNSNWPGKI